MHASDPYLSKYTDLYAPLKVVKIPEGIFYLTPFSKNPNRITSTAGFTFYFQILIWFVVFEDGGQIENTFWNFTIFTVYYVEEVWMYVTVSQTWW